MAAYVTSRRSPLGLLALAGVTLLGLVACNGGGSGDEDHMSWARAALERNDHLEVVAADPQTSTFTVRVKDSGELRTVRADEIVGGPPGVIPVPTSAPAAAPPRPAESAQPLAGTTTAANEPAHESAQGTPAPAPSESTNTAADSSRAMRQADTAAARTGYQPDQAPAAETPNPNSDVASVTPGGRTLESGPGYAIKLASKATPVAARVERERSNKTTAAVERRHEPIICQGDRLVQIDNRNLEFDGDAVAAEDGCELHITNSRISAKGVGVLARRANVHIENSQIEGEAASIDASEGAQVYASSSMFHGMSRRLDNSAFHDLGGNVWN